MGMYACLRQLQLFREGAHNSPESHKNAGNWLNRALTSGIYRQHKPSQMATRSDESLDHWITGSLDHWITGSLDHWITGSLDHWICQFGEE